MPIDYQTLSVEQFKKLCRGKAVYIRWIYSKDDDGWVEQNKATIFQFIDANMADKVQFNIGNFSDTIFIHSLIYK